MRLIPSKPNGKQIKQHPAVWSPGLPLIVVGAVDSNGYIMDFARYQSSPEFPAAAVDVYAPGWQIACDGPKDGQSGTSQGKFTIPPLITYTLIPEESFYRHCWPDCLFPQRGWPSGKTPIELCCDIKVRCRLVEHGQELCQDQGVPKSTKPSGYQRHLEWRGARTDWRRICVLYPSRIQKASRSCVRVWTFRKPKPNSQHCLHPKRSKRGLGSISCQYCLDLERERGLPAVPCQHCLGLKRERGVLTVPCQHCLGLERERGFLGINCQPCLNIECERGLLRVPCQCSFCELNNFLN